ncbi:hypothetical protein B0H17DRAFT_1213296 [Mycena rosella]|uniref:Uncharacterized protein n=1 Tax=Mycena rosella TaxID=1033263 RepID=A0AAD7CQB2_MYCRO|nr:hypothetical protein B0H17DRAFT_1213296 [Mycena rosella]
MLRLTRPNPALALAHEFAALRHILATAQLALDHAVTLHAQFDDAVQSTKEAINIYWVDVGLAKGESAMRTRSGYETKILRAQYKQVKRWSGPISSRASQWPVRRRMPPSARKEVSWGEEGQGAPSTGKGKGGGGGS